MTVSVSVVPAVGHVGRLDLGRVKLEDTLALVVVDAHAVQAQKPRDHVHVTNERDIAQHRGRRPQQRRHHRLGNQVLGSADGDLTSQRATALDLEQTVDHAHLHDVIWACRAREPLTHPRAGTRGRPSISALEGLPGPFSGPYQVAFDSQKVPVNPIQHRASNGEIRRNSLSRQDPSRPGPAQERGMSAARAETTSWAGRCLAGRVRGLKVGRASS